MVVEDVGVVVSVVVGVVMAQSRNVPSAWLNTAAFNKATVPSHEPVSTTYFCTKQLKEPSTSSGPEYSLST